jgi:pyruvate/2-oxoglutarate dehydrogenase complex dihydrolipoamide dehydrogenase (E3) component
MKPKTIAIIGGGSAGFTAARVASDLGARVLFFMGDDPEHASLCIDAGCMPSKALFEPIDRMHHAKRHGWLEVRPREPERYLEQVVRWKDGEIKRFRDYRNAAIRARASDRFQIIRAPACLRGPHEVESAGVRYTFDAAVIATGSISTVPPIEGLDLSSDGVWTSSEILHNTTIPESLAVIGAGAIGLEFSLRYARLGSEVTLLSRSLLLPDYPPEFGKRMQIIYEHENIRVLTSRMATRIARTSAETYEVEVQGPHRTEQITNEKVLVAAGRRPAVDDLNIAAAEIACGDNGRLEIGDDMRICGQTHLFAAGDVTGKRMSVHHSHIEAGIAAENAVNDGDRKWRRRSNIAVIFSDPEFAYAGLTPSDAEKTGCRLVRASAQSRDVGKLHLAGDDLGFGEFCADANDGRLLGAGLLCDDASELIHLPAYAIDHEHTVHTLVDAEFYHPTKTGIIPEIADALCRRLGGHPLERAKE